MYTTNSEIHTMSVGIRIKKPEFKLLMPEKTGKAGFKDSVRSVKAVD